MIYAPAPQPASESVSISANADDSVSAVSSHVRPSEARYKFRQRYFSPDQGQTTIRLYDYPEVVVDVSDFSFELDGWGIHMPCAEIHDLPRQICRRFMTLWGKAVRRSQSDDEAAAWLSILDRVDYSEFTAQRAEPRTLEGVLLRKQPFFYVEWSDGNRTKLTNEVGAALNLLEPDELFTARVKIGRDEQILAVSGVVPLGPKEDVMSEAFADWSRKDGGEAAKEGNVAWRQPS
jgi:hypothetical protein